MEGYASLSTRSEQGTERTKFSFLFQRPNEGRIDVSHVLGQTLYQIIIREEEAFFLIPSKKVYWQGEEEEIIDRLLGFELNLHELVNLLSGQWKGQEENEEGEPWKNWILEKDERGRIKGGRRGDLEFEVVEFFRNTSVVRRLAFRHPLSQGRLKILKLRFDTPLRKAAFSLAFLERFEPKTWEEIEEILDEKKR